MLRYTKAEITGKSSEVKKEVEERLQETERVKEDFERAKEVFDRQDAPALQETGNELNILGQELGREGVKEVEERAELVDRAIEIIERLEKEYKDLYKLEEEEIAKILDSIDGIESPILRRIIEQTIKARKEARDFLKNVRDDLSEHRQESESEIQRKREITRRLAGSIKRF